MTGILYSLSSNSYLNFFQGQFLEFYFVPLVGSCFPVSLYAL